MKIINILVTVCTLAAAVFFFLLGGNSFLQMISGPEPLASGESLEQAEGKYISYEATYPVSSYDEEYYSGDADRVSKYGFVLYDETRRAFLYVIVPEQDSSDFKYLMRDRKMAMDPVKIQSLQPIPVNGTLTRMDADTVKHAQEALTEGKTYDEELAEIWDELAATQKDWYMIEYGAVAGMAKMDIWSCILAAGLSLIIFVSRLLKLFTGGRKEEPELSGTAQNRLEQFFILQRERIMEWCKYTRIRSEKSVYLCVVCVTAGFVVIGFVAKYTPQAILVRHLPLGIFVGEAISVLCWFAMKSKSNWKKLLKSVRKDILKAFPTAEAQDVFAGDYLDSYKEWKFDGFRKDDLAYGVLGDRYWTSISGKGAVSVIDTGRLSRVDTFVDSGSVRYGSYRGRYVFYTAKFFLKDDEGLVYERSCIFPSEKAMHEFAQLAKRKAGDRIEVIEK